MSDATILYTGMFCLAFVLLGIVLTVLEFRKIASNESASGPKRKSAYKT